MQYLHLRGRRRPSGRVRQFLYGLSLPFHLARALLADPVARPRYLRVGLLQTVAALALALTCMGSGKEAAESAREEARAEDRAQRKALLREVAKALTAQQVEEAQDKADRALREAGVTPPQRDEAPAAPSPGNAEAAAPAPAPADARARFEQRLRELEAAAQGQDAGTSLAEAIAALVIEAATAEDALRDGGDSEDEAAPTPEDGGTAVAAQGKTPRNGDGAQGRGAPPRVEQDEPRWTVKGFSLWGLAFWVALFTALQIAQWVVIALSREYHDAIARDASLLTGVQPEDEENTPRVRLDIPWLRKKVKRRWRALMLFLVGLPMVWLLAVPVLCNGAVISVLSSAWAAWWLLVFTAGKSGRAWALPKETPRPPWFLRAWTWLTTRVPGLRWGLLRRYGAFWTRRTQEVLAPIATAERHPWVFAGLTVVRFIGTFPPMKFFLRPLIPVASAHLLAEEAAERAAQQPPAPVPVIPAGETGS